MSITNIISFYGNPKLFASRKTVTEYASKAFNEGKLARELNYSASENPYDKYGEEDNVIWTRYDCWLEGYYYKDNV